MGVSKNVAFPLGFGLPSTPKRRFRSLKSRLLKNFKGGDFSKLGGPVKMVVFQNDDLDLHMAVVSHTEHARETYKQRQTTGVLTCGQCCENNPILDKLGRLVILV